MHRQGRQLKRKKTRVAAAATLAASVTGRFSALLFAGIAAAAVEITSHHVNDSSKFSFKNVHYLAFSFACPAFFIALLCFEKLNLGTWSQAASTIFPWTLLIIAGVIALMPNPWLPLIAFLVLATIAIDNWRLKQWSKSIQQPSHLGRRQRT